MTPPSLRDAVEQAILVSVGAASLTRDRIDHIVGELVSQGRISTEDGRVVIDRLVRRVVDPRRPTAQGLVGHLEDTMRTALSEAGVVTRAEVDDLALHVAELDHRLRLLEARESQPPNSGPGEPAA
jgi:polyhydroxyalkanoate synthesis regulator phasin